MFIPGNVPSLKNSKRFVRLKNGITRLIPSKTVENYLKKHSFDWEKGRDEWMKISNGLRPPYRGGMYFLRDSFRKFDYINAAQIVQDLMVRHGWIEDDNCDFLVPVFLGHKVDKNNPGVIITIENGEILDQKGDEGSPRQHNLPLGGGGDSV